MRPDMPHPAMAIALNMPDPKNKLHFMMSNNPLRSSAKNNELTKKGLPNEVIHKMKYPVYLLSTEAPCAGTNRSYYVGSVGEASFDTVKRYRGPRDERKTPHYVQILRLCYIVGTRNVAYLIGTRGIFVETPVGHRHRKYSYKNWIIPRRRLAA